MRAALLWAMMIWLAVSAPLAAQTRPVVVELFTSQGCSSCPPADAFLLETLAPRSDVIALALHVDYWDYLGWKDHFASPQFTKRQKAYANAAGQRTIYTPQMIIGGVQHVVGTHPKEVLAHIQRQSEAPQRVRLGLTRQGDAVRLRLENLMPSQTMPVDVFMVRYLASEEVEITRGENAGRQVTYANIVTDWRQLLMWDMAEPVALRVPVTGDEPIAVIVQQHGHGPILAAAQLR
ncbi:DUF1223 domain-containing protein [Shimia sp.]|uniref:DUF1223 domain-containing protein n=1 Tax=Shimia sp. TaxID=1954381 RepID=UPI0035625E4C